jgi:hypothetical protein
MLGVLYAAMKSEGDRVSRYLDRARPAPMELYALAGNRFGGPGSEDVVVDGLDLLSSFSLPSREGGELHLHQGLDLVRNRVSPRPFSGADARSARFAQGVKDTVVESLTLPRSLGPRSNTADAYLRSLGGGAKWVVLTRAGDLTDGATGLGPDSRVRVLRALKAGRTVVAPPPGETGTEAWWEVDPETGATIGRIGDGRGGAAEEVVLMMNDAYSLITTMKGVLACRDAKSDLQMACCLLQNAGFGFYGLALGRSLSGAISDLWGVAVNVAYTEATGQIDLCGS